MKRFFAILCLLFVAGMIIYGLYNRAPAEKQPTQVRALAETQPSETPQPTNTPLPTVDLSAPMTQSAIDLQAAQSKHISAEADSLNISNTATLQALNIIRDSATSTAQYAGATATTIAAQATQSHTTFLGEKARSDEREAIETKRLRDAAELERIKGYTWFYGGWSLIGITVICILLGVIKVMRTPTSDPVDENKAEQTTEEYLQEKVDIQTSQTNQAFDNPLEITRIELVHLHNAAVEFGGVLSRRKLMAHGFTQERADELKELLKQPGPDGIAFAEVGKNDTTVLNAAGWALVKASRTPPQWEEIPETTENPEKS